MAINVYGFQISRKRGSSSPSLVDTDAKRRRSSSIPDWGQLDSDVLLAIFNGLSFMDVLQAKAVCSHWHSVAKELKFYTKVHQIPWLLIPPQEEEDNEASSSTKLFSIEEGKVHGIKNAVSKEIYDQSCCVGSSHGCMIFINCERNTVFLTNPLTGIQIELPPIHTFLGSLRITACSKYIIEWVCTSQEQESELDNGFTFSEQRRMREHFIQKAILTSDPCHSDSYGVVLICRKSWKLAFCQSGGNRESSWMYLDGKNAPYHDIMCYENKLYALGNCGALEVWDLAADYSPLKTMTVKPPLPELNIPRDLCTSTFYLVESAGTVLLVARCIGEFVHGDASPVLEEDLLTDEDIQPLVCPYRTLQFRLFRMDFEKKTWVDMESLEDRALFVGANHSASVSVPDCRGCEQNSIYFTDDYWEQMNDDCSYGGHDMGVYNLEDKSVKQCYECNALKIQPPPCWILPNPW